MSARVVVLAGGRGRRLLPLTAALPKPLLTIDGRTVLAMLLERLRSQGFDDVVLAVGFGSDLVEAGAGDGSAWGMRIRYVREPEPLGTAGPLALVRAAGLASDPLLVMNGDLLTEFDLRTLERFHTGSDFDLSIVVRSHVVDCAFGVVECAGQIVRGIREKPGIGVTINAGIYALGPHALDSVPDVAPFDMTDLAARLITRGARVGALHTDCAWQPIDRPEDLVAAEQLLLHTRDRSVE